MLEKIRSVGMAILDSPTAETRRPVLDANHESNVAGLFVVGDLAGAPVIKLAMEHGDRVARHISALPDAHSTVAGAYDALVIGAGASGLTAALCLQEMGLRVLVVEKSKIANTIEDFPEGKWIYAEPESVPASGRLWLEGATKEELLERWQQIVRERQVDVRVGEGVTELNRRTDKHFDVQTSKDRYVARRVVLATGQRGNPRWLGVPGEDYEHVYHRLYSPKKYENERILVVGGGNSAVEAALTLAEQNEVTLSYRGDAMRRIFKGNQRKLEEAIAAGRIEVVLESRVLSFEKDRYRLERKEGTGSRTEERIYDHAFVLVGAELPTVFLKELGLRLENEWTGNSVVAALLTLLTLAGLWLYGNQTGIPALENLVLPGALLALGSLGALGYSGWKGNRFSWLGAAFLVSYTIYGAKLGAGQEFWPYRGWGYDALSFSGRPWAFWYTALYTAVMTVFGIQAMKRWGFARNDKIQIWRYTSLLGFQWIFFFLIPEFLFQLAVKYQWVGEALAADPNFANNAWRSYGIVYAWPLFFYTFFSSPHEIWMVWGAVLAFGIIPILVLFHGKRYCSWICGCGGLAETLGDRWRHLAPKGDASIRWESMNLWVLGAAVAVTVLMLGREAVYFFREPSQFGVEWYRLIADVWLVGIIPVTLYPFFGGKVWCRYWCPLASMMQLFSKFFTRAKVSRFAIHSDDKCIACGECTRYCQVGIDVMRFAMKQEVLTNDNSSCIGCGICVTVCPMDVLSFSDAGKVQLIQIEGVKAA